jgi:hypothetical protein
VQDQLGLLKRRQLVKIPQELKEAQIPWQVRFAEFENDPIYEKAMQLGREYRQSWRPKTAPRGKK